MNRILLAAMAALLAATAHAQGRGPVIKSSSPPLIVVEDKGGDCGEWSRAWPIGVIRAGGDLGGTPTSEAPPEG